MGYGSFPKTGYLIPVFKEEQFIRELQLYRNSEQQIQGKTGMS